MKNESMTRRNDRIRAAGQGKGSLPQGSVDTDEGNVVTGFKWGWYALSFVVPFAGILIAIFLYDQDSKAVRRVGRNCLFIGFLIWVVFPLLVMLALFLFGALSVLSIIADNLPSGD